jgi:hypothetical protein
MGMPAVIHGYAQTASVVADNTTRLRGELAPIADLHYVDGPPVKGEEDREDLPRPWWFSVNGDVAERWDETVRSCSSESTQAIVLTM